MVRLHDTENPISRKERVKLNENWKAIEQAFSDMQVQINTLAGGNEVAELLQDISNAITQANESIDRMDELIPQAETTIEQTNNVKKSTIEATSNANQAIEQINESINEVETLITDVAEKLLKLETQVEENEQLNSVLNALQTSLTQLQTDLNNVISESETATQNATSAYERVKGWTGATVWDVGTTYSKNNVVTYNGSTFQSIVDNNVGNTPSTSSDVWIILAQRGVDGNGSVSSVNGVYPTGDGNVAITWDNIESKPSTFTPSEHTHTVSQITDLDTVLFSGSYNDLKDKPKIAAFVSSEITPDTDMSTLSDGVYYTHPLPNESSSLYLAWRDHIAGFMNITSPSLYMRLMITTVRYYGRNYQIINVLSGATTYLNKSLFTCTRASVTDNNWCDWSFSYPTLYGEGNPQGSVLGVNNMKYIDTLTGDLYVKLSSTKLTPTNAGWAKIGGVTNA